MGLLGLTVIFTKWHGKAITKADSYLNPPPEMIEHFTFGFDESVADSFWLRWIQDSDTCQTYKGASHSESRVTPPISKGDVFYNPRHRVCDNSWAFKMLDAVTKTAPKFEMPYMAGAMALSVLVEDYAGASVIFNRGVEQHPENWMILYRAAYHFLFDTQDLPRAAELLNRAAEHGAPYWVRFLSARVYSRAGQLELALSNLEAYRKTLDDPKAIEGVDMKIASIKREAEKKNQRQDP
ncbi:MAG: tetratricopeptide repeat protein [Bdellovibrionales bacterium]